MLFLTSIYKETRAARAVSLVVGKEKSASPNRRAFHRGIVCH